MAMINTRRNRKLNKRRKHREHHDCCDFDCSDPFANLDEALMVGYFDPQTGRSIMLVRDEPGGPLYEVEDHGMELSPAPYWQ